VRNVGNVRNGGTTERRPVLTLLTLLTMTSCSTSAERAAVKPEWSRVPVAIELRVAQGASGPELIRREVYGQSKTVYLHPQAQISNADVARVEAVKTRIGQGLILQVWYTKSGARKIAELTRQHIGDSLAVLINSVVVATPVIQETINPGTQTSSDIGVPLEPKEANQLALAVSKTWPAGGKQVGR
jgi:preprotein translocase subunit SecD